MNVTDPIRRVSVVSTGQVQIRPDHVAATWRPTAVWLLASRTWTRPRPINAYVIERGYAVATNLRDGRVVIDAAAVEVGDELDLRLRRGRVRARTIARQS